MNLQDDRPAGEGDSPAGEDDRPEGGCNRTVGEENPPAGEGERHECEAQHVKVLDPRVNVIDPRAKVTDPRHTFRRTACESSRNFPIQTWCVLTMMSRENQCTIPWRLSSPPRPLEATCLF